MGKITKKQELIDIATKELNGQFVNNINRKYKEILAKTDDTLIKLNGKNGGNGILEALVPPKEPIIPTLDLDPLKFYESTYTAYGNSYDAPTLVQFAKDKNYPIFDMPIVGINMSGMPFACKSFAQFVWQLSRVMRTDLSYPILLDDHGTICDGWHRVAKAVMEGRSTIKAIRLLEMPDASGKTDTE